MMDIVADFHDISDRQRLQISTDRRPMRRASVVMAALLSSEGEELLSLNLLIASTSSLDKVVTMDTLLAFSVGNANSRVSGTSFFVAKNLTNPLIL
jgi:hypothetical protein